MPAERDLAEREERFRAVFDNALDAMLIADEDARLLDANPAAHALFGAGPGDLGGRELGEVLPPDLVASIWTGLRERGAARGETTILPLAGDGTRDAEFSATASIFPGGHLVALRDVTERNRAEADRLDLEERLNQIQRMETVGQFAGGIAHDFNNLLGVILNYAAFAADAEDLEQAKEDIRELRGAAVRARDLTRRLLVFSRRDQTRAEVFDVAHLVRESSRLADRLLGSAVEVRTEVACDPVLVEADPGQIDQVVMNLVVNARDAMPDGGVLTLSVAQEDEWVELAVGDTGTGMPGTVADRAFEPFFTTKPKGSGTGLGLAMVYGIVTGARGRVSLASEVGEGTRVTVRLPIARGAVTPARPEDPIAVGEGVGRRVLVVEDDDSMRRLTTRILAEAGYVVTAAERGEEAYGMLERSTFELLLTDVVMPGMSGVELSRRAAELRPGLPTVVMSGYNEQMSRVPSGSEFLRKPFTRESLLGALDRVWERRRA